MAGRRIISVVGCHAEGEQGDVITGGVLPPPGDTMMSKKLAFERDHDDVRRLLICEPRGSVARHVNLIVPSTRDDCVAGAIIMEPTEYPPMSGSNTMCIATVLLETGVVPMLEPETRFRLDMPAGPVDIVAECRAGKCVSVTLKNVPAFAFALDAPLEMPGGDAITIDIAYGGMIYAIVDAAALGFEVVPDEARDLAELGEQIRMAAREQHPVTHPVHADISNVSIVQFAGPLTRDGNRVSARNTCIVSPGRSDRSPTGTGTTARMAVLHARGVLQVGGGLTHASIIGSEFHGTIVGETSVGSYPAIEATIRGRAWITGFHHYVVEPDDPWPSGYVLSDTWGTSTSVSQ
ncbi:MAG: trans-L-3-hydroxyproline dehydratase [Ilumatobacteraceae bacterium]